MEIVVVILNFLVGFHPIAESSLAGANFGIKFTPGSKLAGNQINHYVSTDEFLCGGAGHRRFRSD